MALAIESEDSLTNIAYLLSANIVHEPSQLAGLVEEKIGQRKLAQGLAKRRCPGQVQLPAQTKPDPPGFPHLGHLQPKMFVAQRACSFRRGDAVGRGGDPRNFYRGTSRGGEGKRSYQQPTPL